MRSAGDESDLARRAVLCESLCPRFPLFLCVGVFPIAARSDTRLEKQEEGNNNNEGSGAEVVVNATSGTRRHVQ